MDPSQATPEVASFYHLRGASLAGRACRGTACFAARHLNPGRWQEACSREPRVYCLGLCHVAPAALDEVEERPAVHIHAPRAVVLERVLQGGARRLADYARGGGYQGLAAALRRPPEELLQAVEASGLRGRGGAGFLTGRKQRAVASQPPGQRFVVANADEGDPGAYSDRFLLEEDPHALLEGLALAAYAVGANQGFIYLRKEYPRTEPLLREALAEARREGVLGERVLGTSFPLEIELVVGHGSYLCGEETALLNALEDRRPFVRPRPPYPAERGLFGRPTLVQNVETLVNLPWIARHGGAAYAALGITSSRGTKVVSLNSLFRQPGLYEVEFGVPVRTIVEELGGGLRTGALRGVLIGGPLAGLVPPWLLDTPFGFEELRAIGASVGHGGVVAFDEHTSLAELVHHVFSFGAYESCGLCTPCRLGALRIEQLFERILTSGPAPSAERAEWERLISTLRCTSLCGHGAGLGEFAESLLRHYPEEVAACFA